MFAKLSTAALALAAVASAQTSSECNPLKKSGMQPHHIVLVSTAC